jgi:RNA polymerase sigma-70 factor (ECF subfamily)
MTTSRVPRDHQVPETTGVRRDLTQRESRATIWIRGFAFLNELLRKGRLRIALASRSGGALRDGRGASSWGGFIPESQTPISDGEVVRKVCAGEPELFELLMRRYNQRLYRITRAILRDDGEAEDVVQEAWMRALEHLGQLQEPDRFAGWIGRIAIYESWSRARRNRRIRIVGAEPDARLARLASTSEDPERAASGREGRAELEAAIDALPERDRLVFVLRAIDELSTAEAAEILSISPSAVKARFHRARVRLRAVLGRALERGSMRGVTEAGVFPFLGLRCESLRRRVLAGARPPWEAVREMVPFVSPN